MSRTSEQIAEEAWEHLTAAVAAAGDTARSAGRKAGRSGARLAGGTGERFGSAADEAWRRAQAAVDALAGRRRRPWSWVVGGVLAGVAIGFAAAASLRSHRQDDDLTPAAPPTTERVHLDAS
jgi:hypothetical protein